MFGGAGGGGSSKPQQSGGLFGMPAPTDLVSGTLSASTASGFAVKPSFSASSSPPFGSSKSLFGSKTDSASGGSNVFGSLGQKQQSSSSSGLFGKSEGSSFSTTNSSSNIFGSSKLFGAPAEDSGASLFAKPPVVGDKPGSGGGMFGSGLFGGSQSSVKRSAGTRPNTPVFDEVQETAPPSALFSKPPPPFSGAFSSDSPPEKTEQLFQPPPSAGLFGAPDKSSQPTAQSGLFGATTLFPSESGSDAQKLFSRPKINRGSALFGGQSSSGSGGIFTSEPQSQEESSRRSVKSRLGTVQQSSEEGAVGQRAASNPFVWSKSDDSQSQQESSGPAEPEEERDVSETESDLSDQTKTQVLQNLKAGVTVRRSVSKEELATITAVRCEQVPDVVNKTAILAKHFNKFGEVVKVVPSIRRKTAVVHFSEHKGAKAAKKSGKIVNPSIPPIGHIYYCQSSPGSKSSRRSQSGESEVSAELAVMSGGSEELFASKPARPLVKKKVFSMTRALQTSAGEERPAVLEQPETQITITQGASIAELMRIMKQQTHSDDDRWKVLDARDKFIRLKYPKKQLRSGLEIEDMNLIGTCPDLCPEKERYGRSAKNQLRWYEKEEGRLNHLTAVKEHSRSAADQDVPLPHELRPASVLNKTMNFLMSNIVDRVDNMTGTMADWFTFISQLSLGDCQPTDPWSQFYVTDGESGEETVGDWYEYMWSVTRAIRKDITQQNLTDLTALSIVEKCARFHIFCSERLCEESAHNFDRKLNDENLTKCLRTLKHMYHDLEVSGVLCPRETEFRAYDILMNLNEGDTLREIQTLSEEIQKDPQVLFALKCFKAVNSNNYVLFFKLVKKASYLEACILKRYFYQVRKKAVQTILSAYVPGKQVINFPLDNIISWLAFESGAECRKFLRMHGIESEDDIVFLERRGFVEVENVPPMSRSRVLIDSKRTVSLGEIVNGSPLGENPYLEYYPHDSFDDNGYLKPESYEAQDQEVTVSPEEMERMEREEEQRLRRKELANHGLELISSEVLEEAVEELCESALVEAKRKESSLKLLQALESEFVGEILQTIAGEALREKRNELIAKKLEESERAEQQAELCTEIINGWVESLVRDVCQEEMVRVKEQRKLNKFLEHAEPLVENILELVVLEEVESVARLAVVESKKESEEKVEMFRKKLRRKLMMKMFSEWRRLARKSARQRETILNFPPSVSALSCQEQNSRLGWGQARAQRRPERVQDLVRNRLQLDLMLRVRSLENDFVESAILEPFPLLALLETIVTSNLAALQWSLVLSCPEVSGEERESPYLQMVRRKLKKSLPEEGEATEEEFLVQQVVPLCETLVRVSIAELSSDKPPAAHALESTSCLLFIYFTTAETGAEAKARLERLLELLPRDAGGVPLVLLSSSSSAEEDEELFGLEGLVEEGIIKRYDRFTASENIFDLENIVQLTEGIGTLVKHSDLSSSSRLTTKTEADFLEDFVTGEVFSLFYINLRDRKSRDLPHRPPSDLLALFNSGLDHCQQVLREEKASERLVQRIDGLKLPEMVVHDTDNWRQLVEQVLVYLDRIAVAGVDTSVTVSNIERYLARSHRMFMTRCGSTELEVRSPPPELLAWTDIVHSLVLYRLAASDLSQEETVSFRAERLEQWVPGREWSSGLGWAGERETETVQETVDSSMAEARERTMLEVGESPVINKELRDQLRREQKQSMRLETMLEEAVADEKPASQILKHPVHSFEMEEEEDNVEDSAEDQQETVSLRASESVPLISYLSPTLGRLVSPYSLLTRKTNLSARPVGSRSSAKRKAETGGPEREGSGKKAAASKKLSLSPTARPVRSGLDMKLDTLKVTLRHQVEEDVRFEKMLEAALK